MLVSDDFTAEDVQEDDQNKEIPIISKREKLPKLKETVFAERRCIERKLSINSLDRVQSAQPNSRSVRPSSANIRRAQSAKRAASGKPDMSKILSYLKKNKYDDIGWSHLFYLFTFF